MPNKDSTPVELSSDQVIYIRIQEAGIVLIDDSIIKFNLLTNKIEHMVSAQENPVVIVDVNGNVGYQEVLSVLQEARKGGAHTFSIKCENDEPVPVEIEGDN